jgi:hypothetical protein
MADDLKYGYKGADVPQSFGNNKGVFDPADINNLIADNKWTTFGQLELIETQTITSDTLVEFDLTGNYNVYFLTFSDVKLIDTKELLLRFSDDGGITFEASSYQYASQRGDSAGNFSEVKSTSNAHILGISGNGASTNETQNGYMYFYNMLDSSKYGFCTWHSKGFDSAGQSEFHFGSGVRNVAVTYNAIQFKDSGGSGVQQGTFSLYGIRYS